MKKVNWLVVGIIGIVALLLLFGGGMMMGGWGYRGWSMMGPGGMIGPGGMMNNWGYSASPSPPRLVRNDLHVAGPCRSCCSSCIWCCLACTERRQLEAAPFLIDHSYFPKPKPRNII